MIRPAVLLNAGCAASVAQSLRKCSRQHLIYGQTLCALLRLSSARAFFLGFILTFFPVFDVPVFWPILLLYWFVLFFITMKRQIKHMIKYRYLPFSTGKKVSQVQCYYACCLSTLVESNSTAFHANLGRFKSQYACILLTWLHSTLHTTSVAEEIILTKQALARCGMLLYMTLCCVMYSNTRGPRDRVQRMQNRLRRARRG